MTRTMTWKSVCEHVKFRCPQNRTSGAVRGSRQSRAGSDVTYIQHARRVCKWIWGYDRLWHSVTQGTGSPEGPPKRVHIWRGKKIPGTGWTLVGSRSWCRRGPDSAKPRRLLPLTLPGRIAVHLLNPPPVRNGKRFKITRYAARVLVPMLPPGERARR